MSNNLHKIGIKFFNKSGTDVPLEDFIPVFHHWIQNNSLEDLLIDVADYSHVPAGPGTMLIAHEGNYAVDETGNRRGFLYYSKHEVAGDTLAERLSTICRKNLAACQLLEDSDEVDENFQLDYGKLEIFSNDRLHGPNDEQTEKEFSSALQEFLGRLYPGIEYQVERDTTDERERFRLYISLESDASKADELLNRLST